MQSLKVCDSQIPVHMVPLPFLILAHQLPFTYLEIPFSHSPESVSKPEVEQLSFLPYLLLLQTLKEHHPGSEGGQTLRRGMYEEGIVQQILECISLNGHQSRRIKECDTATDPTPSGPT